VADLTQDEAIDRARAIDVESYDVFLDLTAEPVLSRTEVRFRWLRPDAGTFAELRTQGVRSVTLNGVPLSPPEDGRLRLSRAGGGDQAVLMAEAEAGYSQEGRGLCRYTDPADGAGYVMAIGYPDCAPEMFACFDQPDLTATSRFPLPPESARPARPRPQVPYRTASASRSIWSGEDVVGTKMISSQPLASNAAA
jgi:aminopeptidase N